MKLKINPLTIVIIIFSVISHSTHQLCVAYTAMAAHECAHLAAALCIGLRAQSITIAPFGVHLRLKNKIVRSLSDEIILYAAGPLLNGIFALAALLTGHTMLYRLNTALMVMNLLPAVPLDGGVILKRILEYNFGSVCARRIITAISVLLSVLMIVFSVIMRVYDMMNWSVIMMALFLLGNVITSKELYDVDFITGVSGKKKTNRARLVVIDESHAALEAIKGITPSSTLLAAVMENGVIKEIMTEPQLLEKFHGIDNCTKK